MDLARQIAMELLDIQAVYLRPQQPFTWASGVKSPIYTDNRVTLSYPETRTLIENGFVKQIHECINESVLKIVHIYLLFLLATLTEF